MSSTLPDADVIVPISSFVALCNSVDALAARVALLESTPSAAVADELKQANAQRSIVSEGLLRLSFDVDVLAGDIKDLDFKLLKLQKLVETSISKTI